MPTYTVKDIKTNSQWDVNCSYAELQQMLDNSPDLIKVLSTPNFSYSGVGSLLSKTDDGWKDRLKQIKDGSGKGNTIKV
jgi:hypothetical protein|tara:strand:+ start:83 stop:319 length:237 start_codon:yes stop_codon:yes gene_type:complete